MQNNFSIHWEKTKHVLYLMTIFILLGFTLLILGQSITDYTLLDYLNTLMKPWQLSVTMALGATLLIAIFLFIGKQLSLLSEKKQIILSLVLTSIGMVVQYTLLFHIQAVLRHDHLRVFDAGLEILNTGQLSLSDNTGYFGLYPFNISIATFNSLILRMATLLKIPESSYLLSLQCVYLFFMDLGIFFSWKIVRILYSIKNATLFAILCFINPLLYVCAVGCYTTTLMLPLLMWTLLCMILFIKEQKLRKKCFFGLLAGLALGFGSRIRATVFIAGIAFAIYLIIRKKRHFRRLRKKCLCLIFMNYFAN